MMINFKFAFYPIFLRLNVINLNYKNFMLMKKIWIK